ncbi:Protein of unknown function DUF1191 [Dillenia turbinata]|uniref:Uncharacterized protein n=1 Tax=Dillenia turbinata TaxID=194707 RepID=A0AAN8ZMK1_9MAGN
MLPLLICFSCSVLPLFLVMAQSDADALDTLLQDYAYRAFLRPKTGIPYDGSVPSNLTGIQISAMRLRSGSLRSRGVTMYKEFEIPPGVVVQPYVERLVLVYQNLGNWSLTYYPLSGYSYLAPVLGLLAYDASNLSATNLPELIIRASGDPLRIKFSDVKSVPEGLTAKCVWFDLHGQVNFSNIAPGNTCSTAQLGHFSIVVESVAPAPPPISPTPEGGAPPAPREEKNNSKAWIIVGSVLGGIVMLALVAILVMWVKKYAHKKKMDQMEKAAEGGEPLQMTSVANTKAPAAVMTRTLPTLEHEYVP